MRRWLEERSSDQTTARGARPKRKPLAVRQRAPVQILRSRKGARSGPRAWTAAPPPTSCIRLGTSASPLLLGLAQDQVLCCAVGADRHDRHVHTGGRGPTVVVVAVPAHLIEPRTDLLIDEDPDQTG